MSKYIFILGQSSDLAKAEIFSLYNNVSNISQNIVMVNEDLEANTVIDRLGGTIKIAKYLSTINKLDDLEVDWWTKILITDSKQEKINFGFSLYNDHLSNYQKISRLALSVKKNLRQQNISSRLVISKEPTLSSVIVDKNKLIKRELLIIKNQGEYILAQTQAVQDFVSYSQRDVTRPVRDDQSGMLPLKVAQMMLNLAGPKIKASILDPFCGSGTILQEAAMLGYPHIYGSDKDQATIQAAQKNINWFKQNFTKSSKFTFYHTPVEKISQYLKPQSIDLIVSEPFMGEAKRIKHAYNPKIIQDIASQLTPLYAQAFKQFKIILKPNSKIIFIFPIFKIQHQEFYTLPSLELKKLGFTPILPKFDLSQASKNGNLIYSRPGQIVQREIAVYSIHSN